MKTIFSILYVFRQTVFNERSIDLIFLYCTSQSITKQLTLCTFLSFTNSILQSLTFCTSLCACLSIQLIHFFSTALSLSYILSAPYQILSLPRPNCTESRKIYEFFEKVTIFSFSIQITILYNEPNSI